MSGGATFEFKIEKIDQALHTAPVIHVDGATAFIANDSMVRFNLIQDRATASTDVQQPPIERVVCARLVMSPLVFFQLVQWLSENADGLKSAIRERG